MDDGNTLFVSARNYREDEPLPEDWSYFYTADWNIDSLRSALASHVNDKMSILESQRPEESSLDRRRKESVLTSCRMAMNRYESLEPLIEGAIAEVKPRNEFEDILSEDLDDLRDRVNSQFESIVSRLHQIIEDGISSIPSNGKWSVKFQEIKEGVESEFGRQLSGSFREKTARVSERTLEKHLVKYIETNTPLAEEQKKRLVKRIKERTKSFVDELSHSDKVEVFLRPTGITDVAMNALLAIVSGVKLLLIANAPLAIGIFVIAGVWFAIGSFAQSFLTGMMPIGLYAALLGVGPVVAVFVFFSLGWKSYKAAMEKTCMDLKEKARK